MTVDVVTIGDSHQLKGSGVQSAQGIEALPTSRGFDEETDKTPEKTQERLQDKMSRIQEEEMALVGFHFRQARFQFFL